MAALEAPTGNQPVLSEYCTSLDATMKERYVEKVEKIGFDPYAVKPSMFKKVQENPSMLPFIEYPDIVNYLVLQTSWISKMQMKAYKSLEAYNYFVSGWVGDLLVRRALDDRVVVFARVSCERPLSVSASLLVIHFACVVFNVQI